MKRHSIDFDLFCVSGEEIITNIMDHGLNRLGSYGHHNYYNLKYAMVNET